MSSDRGKYCCFSCPANDFSEKSLSEVCPSCGKDFGFPLFDAPATIREYKVLRPLGRGFYGATFVAERTGVFPTRHVLKVVPKAVYGFFNKDFQKECQLHADAANGADYIVGITDAFDSIVSFLNIDIDCYVAVLDFIDGELLSGYLSGKQRLTAGTAAQIAADLFRIHDELTRRRINHNDFHAGNIIVEELSPARYRRDAMAPSIRAVAIDLGSLSDDRRSGGGYKSDLHWIGAHIDRLSSLLSEGADGLTDLDARLALELKIIALSVAPAIESQRTPTPQELIHKLEDSFFRTAEPWRPWRQPLTLRKFDDSYNAQTLEAWNVPQLLVDPDGSWQRSISSPGPLIVTGMRGCGKTMLLRALQFHARAAKKPDESDAQIMQRLHGDGYVGFFVSASALLTVSEEQQLDTMNMFARLAIAYSLEAARSLAHMMDIDAASVNERAAQYIENALSSILGGHTFGSAVGTVQELERRLVELLILACRSDSQIRMMSHASNAFPVLADGIRKCSSVWAIGQVLFLLDDVSTRYLLPAKIEEILSALIFQSPNCAFKLTSETQTIFLSLKSPGGVEPAAHWRDFETFDLGTEVHKRLKQRGGKQFLADILAQRARFFSAHPAHPPADVLGDQSLASIANTISHSGPNSRARKSVYHGISALKAVCVGDIGGAITIYENILTRSNGRFPVSNQAQSDAFQEFCSTHLYLLDRRGSHLKAVAKSFAAASHELLMQSAKKSEDRGLRQYSSIYVRVTAGDRDEQGRKLRELVDAGVFVFQGGAPRTKTKDSDPVQQFKLTFRKVCGLADFIGLSERDRFELSGAQLEDWLNRPNEGADILMRNLRTDLEPDEDSEEDEPAEQVKLDSLPKRPVKVKQDDLFDVAPKSMYDPLDTAGDELLPLPTILEYQPRETQSTRTDALYIALGFEQRAVDSAKRALESLNPSRVVAVSYPEEGRSRDIIRVLEEKEISFRILPYAELRSLSSCTQDGVLAIDATGFTKAAIFQLTVDALRRNRSFTAVYTEAREYYPLEASLTAILGAQSEKNYDALLTQLKDVLSGEIGPYSLELLHSLTSDETRMKALLAFGSAKHERLIHLAEQRDYDMIKVLVDNSKTARATVARLGAEVAVRGAEAGSIEQCDVRDPTSILKSMERVFRRSYREGGLNFEIGLTGDKLEAVAVGAFCAKFPVNNVWYVKPKSFDQDRFTKGTRSTHYFRVEL
ncbi:hypothetical protein [Mesorhizobium sp. M0676]|uniref:ORC-CDC6 family AAA ATPase n=1 Tax=Mesorhizobium sp. M0676 TaxID=2956984 RepID=UPI0033352418